jgi:hypothetical protein
MPALPTRKNETMGVRERNGKEKRRGRKKEEEKGKRGVQSAT